MEYPIQKTGITVSAVSENLSIYSPGFAETRAELDGMDFILRKRKMLWFFHKNKQKYPNRKKPLQVNRFFYCLYFTTAFGVPQCPVTYILLIDVSTPCSCKSQMPSPSELIL